MTAHMCVKSEDMKSRLGPNTSETHNFKPACPLTWVTVSSPIKQAQPAREGKQKAEVMHDCAEPFTQAPNASPQLLEGQ